MSYAKPTIQGKPPKKIYRFDDMEVIWRANDSLLYKSSRMKHYMIVKNRVGELQTDLEAIYFMFECHHGKVYPLYGGVEVLPLSPADRYTLLFYWSRNKKKFIVTRA